MLKSLYKILFSSIFFFLSSFLQDIDTNAKIKSIFIYNYTKYIEWPKDYREGNFIIGIIGNESLKKELIAMSEIKKVGDQKIEIIEFKPESIGKCNMLILSREKNAYFETVVKKIKGKPTLLITEGEGYASNGSCINFVVVNNRLKFEMNKKNIESRGLKLNSGLESLAILVE